ncbi:MAG TPA: cell division protein FtsQ/DivIB [Candidatus Binataceae bacterium]|nr:cell division protein FtsQ/DivIB [Candidatus Binataceae bacterium]
MAGSKKKKGKSGSGWSWRLAGLALCAFFALGVITGLSESGRVLARRIHVLLEYLPHSGRSELIPAAYHTFLIEQPKLEIEQKVRSLTGIRSGPIALVKHADGFYRLDARGGLSGPLLTADTVDLPVLSGNAVDNAQPAQLLEWAGQLVRAEAVLSAIVSEMRINSSNEIRLYLDRPRLMIILAPSQLPVQLSHAARVLQLWQAHQELIAAIDMTVPGEAIVRRQTWEGVARAAAISGAEPARFN